MAQYERSETSLPSLELNALTLHPNAKAVKKIFRDLSVARSNFAGSVAAGATATRALAAAGDGFGEGSGLIRIRRSVRAEGFCRLSIGHESMNLLRWSSAAPAAP